MKEKKDVSDFYDEIFEKKLKQKPTISKHILFNEAFLRVEQIRCQIAGRTCRIMDLGCGPGHFLRRLAKLDDVALTGVDITTEVLARLRQVMHDVEFENVNYSEPQELEPKYDIITMVEVYEHIPDPLKETFLTNVCASLHPGGHLVMTTPSDDKRWMIPRSFQTTQPVED